MLTPYKSQVGLPNPVTEVAGPQVQADTQILQGVGAVTKALGGMADQWMKSKLINDTNTANTEIKVRVNDFNEYQRTNAPIQKDGESRMDARIREWDEFSDKLKSEYISKLDNGQVAENILKQWPSRTEDFKAQVVDKAITENLAYQHNQALTNFQTQYSLAFLQDSEEGYDDLDKMIAGEDDGLNINQSERDAWWDMSKRGRVLLQTRIGLEGKDGKMTGQMSYPDSLKHVEASNLTGDNKAEAKKYLKEQEKLRIEKVVREGMVSIQTMIYEGEFVGTPDGHDKLQEFLVANYPDFDFANNQSAHNILSKENAKLDSGRESKETPAGTEFMNIITDPTLSLPQKAEGYWRLYPDMSRTEQEKFFKYMNDETFGTDRKIPEYVKNKISGMKPYFDKDGKEFAIFEQEMWLEAERLMTTGSSKADIMGESNVNEQMVDKKAATIFQANLIKTIDDLTMNEVHGDETISAPERLIRAAMNGEFATVTDMEALQVFYKRSDMTEKQMKDAISSRTPTGKWDDMTAIEKSKGMFLINAAKVAKLGGAHIEELVPDMLVANTAIDKANGMPIFTMVNRSRAGNPRYARLNFDENTKEEYFEEWKVNPTTGNNEWTLWTGITYPDLNSDTVVEGTLKDLKKGIQALTNPDGMEEALEALKTPAPKPDPLYNWDVEKFPEPEEKEKNKFQEWLGDQLKGSIWEK